MKLNALSLVGASVGLAAAIPLVRAGMRTLEHQDIPGDGDAAAGEHSHATEQAVIESRAAMSVKPFSISDPDVPQKQKDFIAVFNDSIIPFLPPKLPPRLPPENATLPDVIKHNRTSAANKDIMQRVREFIESLLPPVNGTRPINGTRLFQPQSQRNSTIADKAALSGSQDHHHANSNNGTSAANKDSVQRLRELFESLFPHRFNGTGSVNGTRPVNGTRTRVPQSLDSSGLENTAFIRRRPQSEHNPLPPAQHHASGVDGTAVLEARAPPPTGVPKGDLRRRDDDGRPVEKRDFLKSLEEYFRTSSPTSGWKGVKISPEEMRKFSHPRQVPQCGGHNPPISDEDFCILARSMQWFTHKMVPEVEKLVPGNSTEMVKDGPRQRGQLARVARMMVVWEKLLKTTKLQLVWTYVLDMQPHCAVCYLEYCHAAVVLPRTLRDRGTSSGWSGYERAVMHNHVRNVGESQRNLAKILHMSSHKSLINGVIAEDKSAWAEKLRTVYGVGEHDSLRKFVNQRDPIAHDRGVFYEAEQAWRFQWPVKGEAADEATGADRLKKRSLFSNSTNESERATQKKKPRENRKKDRKALMRQKTHHTIPMSSMRKVWAWFGAIEEVLNHPARHFGHYGDSASWNDKAPILDAPQQAANETMRRIDWTVDQQTRVRDIAEELAKDHPKVD